MKITGFPIFRLFAIETHRSAKTPPRQLRGKTGTLWARTGAPTWGWTGAQIVQWLRGHCTGYVRNLGDDFVEAFLERFSPTATKIGAQFRVKRAPYRRKHGPFFLVSEDANSIYDYVAIELALEAMI